MQEVFEKIIEKLKEDKEHTFDGCINKRFAIEIVKQEAEKFGNDTNAGSNGWIPCSERLPDDFMSFEYLTIRKGHTLATITYYCVVNHKWYLSRNSSKEIDVIAWQPLPLISAEGRVRSMEHDGCKGCKYEPCSPESKECQGCKQNSVDKYTRMTNADRIRSMSDEKLAKENIYFVSALNAKEGLHYTGLDGHYYRTAEEVVEANMKWLQSEVEE